MNPKGPRFEDLPLKMQKRVRKQIIDMVAERPVKVRMPYYFKQKGGVNRSKKF